MSNKGVTTVELLIVIVIMGIIAAFSTVMVSEIIENSKQDAFVASGTVMIESARLAYAQGDDLWDDDKATLQELIDGEYIYIGLLDPWNGTYDYDLSYVIIETVIVYSEDNSIYLSVNHVSKVSASEIYIYRVKLISTIATLGFDSELADFNREDIVFLDGTGGSLYEKIISIFDNNLSDDLTTDNGDDEIDVDEDIKNASLVTLAGDDIVTVGDDIRGDASVDLGAGDDTLIMEGEVRDNAVVNTGDGNDTVIIGDDIQNNAVVNTGDGNDTVTIDDDLHLGALLDTGDGDDEVTVGDDLQTGALLVTGSGDDTVNVEDELDDATINTGSGDDTVNIDTIRDDSTVNTGDDNDTLYIRDVSNSFDGSVSLGSGDDYLTIIDDSGSRRTKDLAGTIGTFDGGIGNDTLNLPNITLSQWNDYVSDLFSGFETVILEDTTINP